MSFLMKHIKGAIVLSLIFVENLYQTIMCLLYILFSAVI